MINRLSFFVILLLFACHKGPRCLSEGEPDPKVYGSAFFESNVVDFQKAEAKFSLENTPDLINFDFSAWNSSCDLFTILIRKFPKKIEGKIKLYNKSKNVFPNGFFAILHGGDAYTDRWYIDESFENWIEISKINSDSTEIAGNFEMHLLITEESIKDGKYDPTIPDSIMITKGAFNAKSTH